MVRHINGNVPFDCSYVKIGSGELRIFTGLVKLTDKTRAQYSGNKGGASKRRTGTSYSSLVPFVCPDGSVVELYTRLFIKFNGEDVAL